MAETPKPEPKPRPEVTRVLFKPGTSIDYMVDRLIQLQDEWQARNPGKHPPKASKE